MLRRHCVLIRRRWCFTLRLLLISMLPSLCLLIAASALAFEKVGGFFHSQSHLNDNSCRKRISPSSSAATPETATAAPLDRDARFRGLRHPMFNFMKRHNGSVCICFNYFGGNIH
jgi:hypothetical protein